MYTSCLEGCLHCSYGRVVLFQSCTTCRFYHYTSTEGKNILNKKDESSCGQYTRAQINQPGYKDFVANTPVIGIWDDHDFGMSNIDYHSVQIWISFCMYIIFQNKYRTAFLVWSTFCLVWCLQRCDFLIC